MVGSCSLTSELLEENIIRVICICLHSTSPVSDKLQMKATFDVSLESVILFSLSFECTWGLRVGFFPLNISLDGSATLSYSSALEEHLPQ